MTPWIHLTKKELRLGFPAFLFSMIGSFGVFVLWVVLGIESGFIWEGMMMWSVLAILFNFFYLVFYMSYSLNTERKRMHLWLHNPLPTYKLLLAKFVSGLSYMFIFLFTIIIVIGISCGNLNFSMQMDDWKMTFFLSIIYYLIFIVSNGWGFTFLWTIYMSFKKSIHPFYSFVLTFVILMFLFWMVYLSSVLFQWGAIESHLITGFEFTATEETFHVNFGEIPTTFYIGHFIEALLLILFFFIGSAWMLERKVEV